MELFIQAWLRLVEGFGWFILVYMVFIICFYSLMLLFSFRQLRKELRLNKYEMYEELMTEGATKPISILVPAYNEEAGIYDSVRSLLNIHYPEFEIIVINDGSKDDTMAVMIEKFNMKAVRKVVQTNIQTQPIRRVYRSDIFENLYVIDKDNGGKADALNAGLNLSNYPYFCSLDGDSILEQDAFLKVMKPIVDSNGEVIASGGSIRIANGCKIEGGQMLEIGLSKNPLVVLQVIEYLRAFLMGRIGLSYRNWLLIVSGAFGVFSKSWVLEAGGYKRDTVGEDMELVVRLHRLIKEKKATKKIVYIPEPVCWTEAPEAMTYLRRQRSRWHRGLFESLLAHRKLLFNPKYGSIGFISLPYFWFIEAIGPLIELGGYLFFFLSLFLGGVYVEFGIVLLLLSVLYGSVFSMFAVVLEEWSMRRYPKVSDVVRLFFYSLTETFWYRPLTVLWRLEGVIQLLRRKQTWGEMKRKGLSGGISS
ncbi:cellulose synthase/poly-beta-1,6-N-acetylglucosamine synthase-like glycosyltransferase [Bacillus fengqiuensis]|nr:cellulose synthase/poly-beta-1,6-N-acetylglucosamine synthase-like glycosyltransferase [Bacillus fengqiuensis]